MTESLPRLAAPLQPGAASRLVWHAAGMGAPAPHFGHPRRASAVLPHRQLPRGAPPPPAAVRSRRSSLGAPASQQQQQQLFAPPRRASPAQPTLAGMTRAEMYSAKSPVLTARLLSEASQLAARVAEDAPQHLHSVRQVDEMVQEVRAAPARKPRAKIRTPAPTRPAAPGTLRARSSLTAGAAPRASR